MIHMTVSQGLHQDMNTKMEQVQVQDLQHGLLEFCRDAKENLNRLLDEGVITGDWDGPFVAIGVIIGTAAQWYGKASKKKLLNELLKNFSA